MSQLPPDMPSPEPGSALRAALREIAQPFRDFVHTPIALWGVNGPYYLEGLVYFGIITVITMFLSDNVRLGDVVAGWVVGAFTGGITGAMFFLGGIVDRWGVRRALIVALCLLTAGRLVMALGETLHLQPGLGGDLFSVVSLGMLLVVIGYGFYQPAAYAAVKQFTDERTAAMGYAMLYALMNLGSFSSGLISPPVRRLAKDALPPNGITGVLWVYVGVTLLALLTTLFILTPRTVQQGTRTAISPQAAPPKDRAPGWVWRALREHPLMDAKFSFFIFVLIPVQTLFAHNWLTLPLYIERAFRDVAWISGNFELFSNLNPVLIFILTPLMAALTARSDVYLMMIIGTSVMAVPTFLLSLGPNPVLLFVYIFAMSVGEAMWQPRFLQYAAEIAPEGKTGLYMGVAQFPWFLTKVVTSWYSGWFLARYCPAEGPRNTEFMWFFHSLVACTSPIILLLARRWIGKGLERR